MMAGKYFIFTTVIYLLVINTEKKIDIKIKFIVQTHNKEEKNILSIIVCSKIMHSYSKYS